MDFSSQIAAARQAGYSDDEIRQYLHQKYASQFDAAKQHGYSDDEIYSYMGMGTHAQGQQSAPPPQATQQAQPQANQQPQAQPTVMGSEAGPVPLGSIANGAALGFGPQLAAAGADAGLAEARMQNPALMGQAVASGEAAQPQSYYNEQEPKEAAAQQQYSQQNPTKNAIGELLGSVPTLSLLGNAFNAAVKGIPLVGNYLSGAAGYDENGRALSGVLQLGNRVAGQAVSGAAQGALAGAVSTPMTGGDLGQNALAGAKFGGALGATAGPVLNATNNFIRGPAMTPQAVDLAERSIQAGITPVIQNNRLSRVVNAMPFSGKGAYNEQTEEQIRQALGRSFGEDTASIGPQTLQQAAKRIGGVMDETTQNTAIPADTRFMNELTAPFQDAQANQVVPDNMLQKLANTIGAQMDQGVLSGKGYQKLTDSNSMLTQMQNSNNPNIRDFAASVRSTLDNALVRNMTPEDYSRWQNARQQWKNMKIAEELAVHGGPSGEVPLQALSNKVAGAYPSFPRNDAGTIGTAARAANAYLQRSNHQPVSLGQMLAGDLATGAVGGVAAHVPRFLGYGLTFAPPVAASLAGRMANAYFHSPGYVNALLGQLGEGGQLGVPLLGPAVATGNMLSP